MIFMIRLVYIETQEIYIINFKSSPGHELGWYIMKSSGKCSAEDLIMHKITASYPGELLNI